MILRGIAGFILAAVLAFYCFFVAHEARLSWFDVKPALAAAAKYDATIVRDRYGVPHISGKRDADAAFGLAYAHAEDDFGSIQRALIAARGRLASVDGIAAAEGDYLVQLMGIWQVIDARYASDLSPDTRALLDGYAAGLNLYAAQHRDAVLPGFAPARGQDLAALFMLRLPSFYGLDVQLRALLHGAAEKIAPSDANIPHAVSFAVAPARAPDGATRLLINPQGPFEGPLSWYEARINSAEGWNMEGGLMPGSPLFLEGATPDLGWGFAANHPNLIDVYRLEGNPNDRYFYRFDGEWRRLQTHEARIVVRFWSPIRWTFRREILTSVQGPVIRNAHGLFAVHYAGQNDLKGIEAFYRLNKAQNFAAFTAVLATGAIPSLDFVFADKTGRIAEFYNGAFPERAGGYDWTHAVAGNTSATVWDNYLPASMALKTVAPPSGFVIAANASPFHATSDPHNPKPADYAPSMGIETGVTNRALRALALLSASRFIDAKAFRAVKFDTCYAPGSAMAMAVKDLAQRNYAGEPLLEEAGENLRRYDLCSDKDNRGAGLGIVTAAPLLRPGGTRLDPVVLLRNAAKGLLSAFGRIDPPWGSVSRLRRASLDLPLSGGPDALRDVEFQRLPGNGISVAHAGDALILISTWARNGTWSVDSGVPFGSSTVDGAAHYADQAQLFADGKLKTVPLTDAALKSQTTAIERPGKPKAGAIQAATIAKSK
jgi:acyl-homoserine-lactone acylase